MNARIRENEAMRRKRGFFRLDPALMHANKREMLKYRHASPEEFQALKRSLARNKQMQIAKSVFALAIALIIASLIAMQMFHYLTSVNE